MSTAGVSGSNQEKDLSQASNESAQGALSGAFGQSEVHNIPHAPSANQSPSLPTRSELDSFDSDLEKATEGLLKKQGKRTKQSAPEIQSPASVAQPIMQSTEQQTSSVPLAPSVKTGDNKAQGTDYFYSQGKAKKKQKSNNNQISGASKYTQDSIDEFLKNRGKVSSKQRRFAGINNRAGNKVYGHTVSPSQRRNKGKSKEDAHAETPFEWTYKSKIDKLHEKNDPNKTAKSRAAMMEDIARYFDHAYKRPPTKNEIDALIDHRTNRVVEDPNRIDEIINNIEEELENRYEQRRSEETPSILDDIEEIRRENLAEEAGLISGAVDNLLGRSTLISGANQIPNPKRRKKEKKKILNWSEAKRNEEETDIKFKVIQGQLDLWPNFEKNEFMYERPENDNHIIDEHELRLSEKEEFVQFAATWYATLNPSIIDTTTIDERTGIYVPSEGILEVFIKCKNKYGWTPSMVVKLVMLRLGITPDMNKKIFGIDMFSWKISEQDFLSGIQLIEKSMELNNGNPLGVVDSVYVVMGDVRRYPICHIDDALAESLVSTGKGPLSGMTADELQEMCRKQWVEDVKPDIIENCPMNQRYAMWNGLYAILRLSGESPDAWNVRSAADFTYDEFMFRNSIEKEVDPENAEVCDEKERRARKAKEYFRKNHLRESKSKDANGDLSYHSKQGPIQQGFNLLANFIKVMGVVGDPVIIISGLGEKAIGTVDTLLANSVLGINMNESTRWTQNMKEQCYSIEGREAIQTFNILEDAGGVELQTMFANSGRKATPEEARQFLSEKMKDPSTDSKTLEKMKKANDAFARAVDTLMPGAFGFRKQDAYIFMQALMLCMEQERKAGRPYLTSEEIERAMAAGGVGRVFSEAMQYRAGREAFLMMRNQNLSRVSPLGYFTNKFLRANGVTNFAVTTCLSTYINYGVNYMQLFIPFSNTFSYLAVKGFSKEGSEIREYQMGADDEFWEGLKKNFIYDAARIANIGAIACFGFIVLGVLGIEPPEDPENMFCWDEYRIGKNIFGEEGATEYRVAWWMNDLVNYALPLSVAMHAYILNPSKPEVATNVFWDGVGDMISGTAVLDALEFVSNSVKNVTELGEMTENTDITPSDTWKSNMSMSLEYLWQKTLSKITPGVIKRAMRDTALPFISTMDRDHTAYEIYDRDSNVEGKTKKITDINEIQIRSWAKYNPLYALWLNLTKNGYLFDDGTTERTGYLFSEMPIAKMKDQRRSTFIQMFEFDPMNPEEVPTDPEERAAFFEQSAMDMLAYIDTHYEYPEQAIADGFAMGYNSRKNLGEYCFIQLGYITEGLYDKAAAGFYKTRKDFEKGSATANDMKSYYWDIINKYVKNDDIAWTDAGYEKLITDYQVIYRWRDSGELANSLDALNPWNIMSGAIVKEYKPYGNHPSSILPFTSVDHSNSGYNAETIPNWYVEGLTDVPSVYEESGGVEVKTGRDEGKELRGVLFGGYGNDASKPEGYNIDESGVPTIGYRAYVASDGSLPDDIKNMTAETVAKKYNLETNKKSGSNYGSYKKYYSASGRSSISSRSYNPKIYSITRNVNADRASSLDTRRPYSATNTYLKPAFSTKGSREAYRRQDM